MAEVERLPRVQGLAATAATLSRAGGGYDSGTITKGFGSIGVTCQAPCAAVTFNGTYDRTDTAVSLSGSVYSGCLPPSEVSGDCVLVPNDINPVTDFELACEFEFTPA